MIIDGRKLAAEIKMELKDKVRTLSRKPGLAVIRVGEDPASRVYVNIKAKTCEELGFHSEVIVLDEKTSEEELLRLIDHFNQRSNIDGILVQLPLPKHISEQRVIMAISPDKDVDGFHPLSKFTPCTPKGIIQLIESVTSIKGQHAVVVGRSNIVGKPVAKLLLNKNATVTICHSQTNNLAEFTKQADILVAAVGKSFLITAEMVKPGAVVIDVGVNRQDKKLIGDVDYSSVKEKAAFITPVPGGVGPMTVACLMQNTFESYLTRS